MPEFITLTDYSHLNSEREAEPLRVGDMVTPILVPTDAINRRKTLQIRESSPLKIKAVRGTGKAGSRNFFLRFEGTEGEFEACFFKKFVEQTKEVVIQPAQTVTTLSNQE